MAQDLPLVLRLPRSEKDKEPKFILVRVSQEGLRPLDVKLTGTNNAEVFTISLKHNKTSALKAKNSKSSQQEWENVLSAVLLGDLAEGVDTVLTEGLEAVTKIQSEVEGGEEINVSLTITIQKRIEGITQKLGEITLLVDDLEIDMYEWAGFSIESKDTIRKELETSRAALRDKDDHIKRIDESLAELTKLKNENEDQLFEKFSLLLNEKKLKIRDQQRLLAASTVDPMKLEEVEGSRAGTRERSAGPSRARKRKAGAAQVDSDEESDGGFEKMEADVLEPIEDSDKDDERTASETESDSDAPPIASSSRNTRGASAQPSVSKPSLKTHALPPKRELPFARKPPRKPVPVEGSEIDSDDEL